MTFEKLACRYGCQRVGNRQPAIIVAVNAEPDALDARAQRRHNAVHFIRHASPVGIAEHHPLGTGFVRGARARDRVVGVRLVAIKKVLAVEHGLAAVRGNCMH